MLLLFHLPGPFTIGFFNRSPMRTSSFSQCLAQLPPIHTAEVRAFLAHWERASAPNLEGGQLGVSISILRVPLVGVVLQETKEEPPFLGLPPPPPPPQFSHNLSSAAFWFAGGWKKFFGPPSMGFWRQHNHTMGSFEHTSTLFGCHFGEAKLSGAEICLR